MARKGGHRVDYTDPITDKMARRHKAGGFDDSPPSSRQGAAYKYATGEKHKFLQPVQQESMDKARKLFSAFEDFKVTVEGGTKEFDVKVDAENRVVTLGFAPSETVEIFPFLSQSIVIFKVTSYYRNRVDDTSWQPINISKEQYWEEMKSNVSSEVSTALHWDPAKIWTQNATENDITQCEWKDEEEEKKRSRKRNAV